MSILTITLNSCVDKTYTVPGFALDRVHRPTKTLVTAGGKGINVARVYHAFGGDVTATGFLGGTNGEWLRRAMVAEGITPDFVSVAEESRVCIAIIDPIGGTQTELNENGPTISPAETEHLLTRLRELLPGRRSVVISGSLPPRVPPTLYQDIIRLAQEEFQIPVVLDTSGDPLALSAPAQPFLLKPNVHELAALGIAADGWGVAAEALRAKYRLPLAMITGGERGAVLASSEGTWEAIPPQVTVASAVGSGDTLTAVFLWALHNGYNEGEALRLGAAAGAANATTYGAGFFSRTLAFELAARTALNKLD